MIGTTEIYLNSIKFFLKEFNVKGKRLLPEIDLKFIIHTYFIIEITLL